MAPTFLSLLNVTIVLWGILDELDIDDGITSLSCSCRALHECLYPYMEGRVRRRFKDTPTGLVAGVKLARLAELERQAPLENGSPGRVFWKGLFSEDKDNSIWPASPVYSRPEVSEHTYSCRRQYEEFQEYLTLFPSRKYKFDAIADILQASPVIGLDDVLNQFEPRTREDQLRRLRFLSDLCRLNQQSTKFIEKFLEHQADVAKEVTPCQPPEEIEAKRRLAVPYWFCPPEVQDLLADSSWGQLVRHLKKQDQVVAMQELYQRWERAFAWVGEATGPGRRPLSRTERSRIERAFFRLETHSLLVAMLIHEPMPQFRLAMRLFVGAMHHWEVEELTTIHWMVGDQRFWDGISTSTTLPIMRDIGPHATPRTYYDTIILASLRKYDRNRILTQALWPVFKDRRHQLPILQEDVASKLPAVTETDRDSSSAKDQDPAQQPNHAWLCYANAFSSGISKLWDTSSDGPLPTSPVAVSRSGSFFSSSYVFRTHRIYGWSLLDRDTIETLRLDQESSYEKMVRGAYNDIERTDTVKRRNPQAYLTYVSWCQKYA